MYDKALFSVRFGSVFGVQKRTSTVRKDPERPPEHSVFIRILSRPPIQSGRRRQWYGYQAAFSKILQNRPTTPFHVIPPPPSIKTSAQRLDLV